MRRGAGTGGGTLTWKGRRAASRGGRALTWRGSSCRGRGRRLAAAARLAAQGHRVELHERAATHGGKLGEYRRDGFTFDTGPSLLTLPQVFTSCSPPPAARRPGAEPVDPVCGYRFADGTALDLPFDPAAVPAALDAALGPGAGAPGRRCTTGRPGCGTSSASRCCAGPCAARDLARFRPACATCGVVAPW